MADSIRFPVTGGSVLIDADDLPLVEPYRWHSNRPAQYPHRYAARWPSRSLGIKPRKAVLMHRELLDAPPALFVDHINGDTLDNRRSNLRLVTREQNRLNRHRHSQGRGPYKGIWQRQSGKWTGKVCRGGRCINLGVFATPEEAARAYDEAAKELHGQYARLNFPEAA